MSNRNTTHIRIHDETKEELNRLKNEHDMTQDGIVRAMIEEFENSSD